MVSPHKPREKEEEYFLKLQVQKLKEHVEKRRQAKAKEELEKLKELHWMRCPKCGMKLEEITYREVKIDKCFSCGGVFLDDGELEAVAASEGTGGVLSGLSRILGGKGKGKGTDKDKGKGKGKGKGADATGGETAGGG